MARLFRGIFLDHSLMALSCPDAVVGSRVEGPHQRIKSELNLLEGPHQRIKPAGKYRYHLVVRVEI